MKRLIWVCVFAAAANLDVRGKSGVTACYKGRAGVPEVCFALLKHEGCVLSPEWVIYDSLPLSSLLFLPVCSFVMMWEDFQTMNFCCFWAAGYRTIRHTLRFFIFSAYLLCVKVLSKTWWEISCLLRSAKRINGEFWLVLLEYQREIIL